MNFSHISYHLYHSSTFISLLIITKISWFSQITLIRLSKVHLLLLLNLIKCLQIPLRFDITIVNLLKNSLISIICYNILLFKGVEFFYGRFFNWFCLDNALFLLNFINYAVGDS